ncbi:penicillin acylase family protein [Ornithinicoccus halotolerans]|uniref:penicillin acylase family protein n=1 Tax=Ornithinicoccus halotolerans TaxID=1748220 RepID=UPI001295E8FC|nr:penicillin acylase family protein [Ornithinicoccus halotolerans]
MPKVLRRLLLPLVVVVVFAVVGGAVLGVGLVRRPFPQTTGEQTLPGLSAEVEVLRDEQGVPHIYADTPEDLFRAQGYVAAQDRFFQMDLRRKVASGRLAELVGEEGLASDTLVRTLGWRRVASQELPTLSADTRRYLAAYAEGVNAYLANNPARSEVALEYLLLGQQFSDYQLEPWDEVDSLVWLKAMAWDLRGNYTDELTRARLAGNVALEQLNSLYPEYPFEEHAPVLGPDEWEPGPAGDEQPLAGQGRGGTGPHAAADGDGGGDRTARTSPPALPPLPEQQAAAVERTEQALGSVSSLLGTGEGIGSNAWVVAGEHTQSGLPLLANDPHLAVGQPSPWLQAGLHCRQVDADCPFDVSGFSFAGFPGVVIGHNDRVAWGFTNLDPDVTDFYLEEVDGDRYRRDGSWEPLRSREETIQVAGGEDRTITVRETVHGPLLSDVSEPVAAAGRGAPLNGIESSERYEVSLAWTGLERTQTADAVFALNRASNWEQFRAAARLFAVPAQNMLYADVEGNIGYQAPGLVPVRESSTNGAPPGFWPAPGWNSSYDWQGWVPFDQLPHALNPEDGVIVSANQAVTAGSRPFLTTEWADGYRSERIRTLLEQQQQQGPLTTGAMTRIQTDATSDFADTLLPVLRQVRFTDDFYAQPQDLLRRWDHSFPAENGEQAAAAMYYTSTWAHLLALTFNDELPRDLTADGGERWKNVVTRLLERPEDPWWDDRRTVGVVETRDEIVRQALIEARLDLTRRIAKEPEDWQWGRLHQVSLTHPVLGGDNMPDVVQGIFNEGPFPAPGSTGLVNAMKWDASTGSYRVTDGPSMRMVVDLANLDASRWVNQTGVSGHPFHPHFSDQTQAWLEGATYRWRHGRAAVEEAAEATLRLLPDG